MKRVGKKRLGENRHGKKGEKGEKIRKCCESKAGRNNLNFSFLWQWRTSIILNQFSRHKLIRLRLFSSHFAINCENVDYLYGKKRINKLRVFLFVLEVEAFVTVGDRGFPGLTPSCYTPLYTSFPLFTSPPLHLTPSSHPLQLHSFTTPLQENLPFEEHRSCFPESRGVATKCSRSNIQQLFIIAFGFAPSSRNEANFIRRGAGKTLAKQKARNYSKCRALENVSIISLEGARHKKNMRIGWRYNFCYFLRVKKYKYPSFFIFLF